MCPDTKAEHRRSSGTADMSGYEHKLSLNSSFGNNIDSIRKVGT